MKTRPKQNSWMEIKKAPIPNKAIFGSQTKLGQISPPLTINLPKTNGKQQSLATEKTNTQVLLRDFLVIGSEEERKGGRSRMRSWKKLRETSVLREDNPACDRQAKSVRL